MLDQAIRGSSIKCIYGSELRFSYDRCVRVREVCSYWDNSIWFRRIVQSLMPVGCIVFVPSKGNTMSMNHVLQPVIFVSSSMGIQRWIPQSAFVDLPQMLWELTKPRQVEVPKPEGQLMKLSVSKSKATLSISQPSCAGSGDARMPRSLWHRQVVANWGSWLSSPLAVQPARFDLLSSLSSKTEAVIDRRDRCQSLMLMATLWFVNRVGRLRRLISSNVVVCFKQLLKSKRPKVRRLRFHP